MSHKPQSMKSSLGSIGRIIKTRFRLMSLRANALPGLVISVVIAALVAAVITSAATPPSGTLTDISGPVTYTAGPFTTANASPIPQVDTGPRCNGNTNPCDNFALTVTLPSGYHAAHPNAAIKFTLSWGDTGSGQSDYDLYIYQGTVGNTSGSQPADAQSAGGSNPEVATFSPVADGSQAFSVKIVPFTPTNEIVTVSIELLPGSGGTVIGPFGGPDPTVPGNPRYQNFYAPNGTSAQSGSGEFNIGFDPITKRIMTMNIGPIWRLTPGEVQVPSLPECCEALWEDKSSGVTDTGLDPILWTDQTTGRTFASNSTAGANAVYAYTDAAAPFNDGDTWVPVGISPPNGGADHETIGSGPYPLVLGLPNPLINATNQGEAVYYCSQDIVGPASCQRSDDLGATYGPGVLAYDGVTTNCGGLHGHVHVAPDGRVWLPVNQCAGQQGGAVSTDDGVTWTEFIVTGSVSQSNGADPSVAIDSNNTAYYCYVNNEPVAVGNPPEGHVHAKVSTDGGATWIRDFDLGSSHGIVNAAHTEAVGGSAGRAACGFFGTNVAGDYQSGSFPGKWYTFIATTYDGGLTWTTVNATPNDPVQSMTGIWQQGGGNQDRNLLDFNEITVDDKGHVLYGYSDGCTSGPCIAGTAGNDYNAYMRVARQSGGKSIFASYDVNVNEPAAPKPPCLSGTRDPAASHLAWKIPDNGGSDIIGYQILRGETTGSETVIVNNTGNNKNSYEDTTASPLVPHYFYVVKAINTFTNPIGPQSNEIDLPLGVPPPVENACTLPGLTILTDPADDELDMDAGHDVQHLWIAEPSAFAPNKVVFTLKMQSLATVPQDTEWPVTFDVGGTNYTVQMTNSPVDGATTVPIFQVGPTAGPLVAADPASNFNADGTITIVVPRSAIGNPAPGQSLTGFLTRIAANLVGVTITPDNMPDSLTPTGSYTIIGNASCTTASHSNISGRITTEAGNSVGGVVLTLSGNSGTRMAITNSQGDYRFTAAETGGFYTVTPALANYHFSPAERSFSLLGDKTDAVFTASADNTQTANAIDSAEFFVRQHYVDFLGREPDQGGFDYWSAQINQCQGDAACIRSRRIGVSAAFFIEQEFQQTGSFIYDLYKGALGRRPAFAEYSNDRQKVVGGTNLDAEKSALAESFVQRPEFTSKYQAYTTAESFVDALIQNALQSSGVDLSSQRDRYLSAYQSGSNQVQSRSLVVRGVADEASFKQAQYNAAFVLAQYFGYLQRNPDQGGYDFWLNVLNSNPSNFRGMVCAFITSAEYQDRFGSIRTHNNSECSGSP